MLFALEPAGLEGVLETEEAGLQAVWKFELVPSELLSDQSAVAVHCVGVESACEADLFALGREQGGKVQLRLLFGEALRGEKLGRHVDSLELVDVREIAVRGRLMEQKPGLHRGCRSDSARLEGHFLHTAQVLLQGTGALPSRIFERTAVFPG